MKQIKQKNIINDCIFISPFRSFHASGCFTRITTPAWNGENPQGQFQRAISQAFSAAKMAGIHSPIITGAIPFDTRQPSQLFIPKQYQWLSNNIYPQKLSAQQPPSCYSVSRLEIPARPVFLDMVSRGVQAIRSGVVDKVVLSRLIEVTYSHPVDSQLLMASLVCANPGSFNFHIPLMDGGILMGASPELLLRKNGHQFYSCPLAGSIRRDPNLIHDTQAGDKLMNSDKDHHEHELVVRAIKDKLTRRKINFTAPETPELIATSGLWHLATPVEGKCEDNKENALSLACLLHPTPALSGFPHEAACELIARLEPFNRELFGGIVGWSDEQGNGEWVVVIRSAFIHHSFSRFFAGVGIVNESDPKAEWLETEAKFSTMLNVFGLSQGA